MQSNGDPIPAAGLTFNGGDGVNGVQVINATDTAGLTVTVGSGLDHTIRSWADHAWHGAVGRPDHRNGRRYV